MNIALDITPISDKNSLHAVRGAGFYIQNLKNALITLKTSDQYQLFTRGEKLGNVDLIHYPYFEPFFLTLPLLAKTKTVVTVHDLIPLVFPKLFPVGIRGKIKWAIQKIALKRVDAVITDSYSSKDDICRLTDISEKKVFVVPLAAAEQYRRIKIQESRIKELRTKYKLPEEFVLYVGDVTPNKNVSRLIEAIKKTDIPLVLVGKALINRDYDKNNPWNKDLILVQQGTSGNNLFHFLGFVEDNDLTELYNIATAFVLPSLYEGFGLPVLEAMQSGCPVICSKDGSLKEVAGDAAYFIDPYNTDSIARGIKALIQDKKLHKNFSEKGIAQAKKFNWKKTAEETLAVYHHVLSL